MSNLIKSSLVSFSNDTKKIIIVENDNTEKSKDIDKDINAELQKDLVQKQKELDENKQNIINQAHNEANDIIEKANQKAIEIKQSAVEEGKKEGYKKGYDEGFKKGKDESDKLISSAKKQMEKNKIEYEDLINKLEPKFAKIITDLLYKFTGILLEDKKEIIIYLINMGVRSIEISNKFIVKISEEDYDFVINNKNLIYGSQHPNVKIEIINDANLSKGQCVIETENGSINSSLDMMLLELSQDIKLISNT